MSHINESGHYYIDGASGQILNCAEEKRWELFSTAVNSINTSFSVVSSLLLIDEILRAGKATTK